MASNPQEQQQEQFSAKISEDINCSVCLDILVRPQTFVPCGHSFCRSCCTSDSLKNGRRQQNISFTDCPQCRQAVESIVPSRQLECLIDTLVTVPNLIFRNDDDKQHFLERMKKEKERPPTKQVSTRSRKRQRQNGPHSQNYDFTVPGARAQPTTAANSRIRHPTGNTARHDVEFGTPFATSATTANHAFFYDPMLAPMPPLYAFSGAGPVPDLNLTRAIFAPDLPVSRVSQTTTSTGTAAHCQAQSASGISASDAICID